MDVWGTPEFVAELRAWVEGEVGPVSSLTESKRRPWAAVWRVETARGAFYAKQNCPGQAFEARLMGLLAELAPSYVVPVAAVDGAQITTVEGLGDLDDLSTVQAAFHARYAAQCGFCTSGMMLAAHALIERNGGVGAALSREQVQAALGGHVCRCTGYVKIIDAVAATVRGESFDATVTAAGTSMTNLGGVA